MPTDELYQVLLVYILEVSTYPVDMFSTVKLTNKKKHIKKMKKIFYILVKNIINIYENNLKQTVEKIENEDSQAKA